MENTNQLHLHISKDGDRELSRLQCIVASMHDENDDEKKDVEENDDERGDSEGNDGGTFFDSEGFPVAKAQAIT